MEGISTVRRVGEADISSPHLVEVNSSYGDDLYAKNIAQKTGIESRVLDDYLYSQETTHIKEGLRLQQRSVSEFTVFDGSVRDSFGERLTDLAQRGHDAQKKAYMHGQGFDFMVQRTAHDIEIAEDNDRRMNNYSVGQAWFRVTPYAEEVSDKVAEKAGFWPTPRRAFVWLYRKKGENVLETTIISVDRSDVGAFAGVLSEYGVELPVDITSHNVSSYVADVPGEIVSNDDRETIADQITESYATNANYVHASGDVMTSDEFVARYAQEDIHSIIRLQKEILHSLKSRSTTPYVREATLAVLKERFIDDDERAELMKLINLTHRDINTQTDSLRLLIKAHRVGVWRNLSKKIERILNGEEIESCELHQTEYVTGGAVGGWEREQLNHNTLGTTEVVNRGETMPGCSGGSSFTSKDEDTLKENAFNLTDTLGSKKWMNCPFCKEKDAVYADVCAKDLKCRHCTAEVKNGKVTSKGKAKNTKSEKPKKHTENEAPVPKRDKKIAEVVNINGHPKSKKSKIQMYE